MLRQTHRNWSKAINMPFWMGPQRILGGKRLRRFPAQNSLGPIQKGIFIASHQFRYVWKQQFGCNHFFHGIRGYQFWGQWNIWLANFVEYVLNSKKNQSILRLKWCNFKEFINWPMKSCFLGYSLQLVPGKSSPELIASFWDKITAQNCSEH